MFWKHRMFQLGRNCIATEILICDGNVYQVSVRLAHLPVKYKAQACLCRQTGGTLAPGSGEGLLLENCNYFLNYYNPILNYFNSVLNYFNPVLDYFNSLLNYYKWHLDYYNSHLDYCNLHLNYYNSYWYNYNLSCYNANYHTRVIFAATLVKFFIMLVRY